MDKPSIVNKNSHSSLCSIIFAQPHRLLPQCASAEVSYTLPPRRIKGHCPRIVSDSSNPDLLKNKTFMFHWLQIRQSTLRSNLKHHCQQLQWLTCKKGNVQASKVWSLDVAANQNPSPSPLQRQPWQFICTSFFYALRFHVPAHLLCRNVGPARVISVAPAPACPQRRLICVSPVGLPAAHQPRKQLVSAPFFSPSLTVFLSQSLTAATWVSTYTAVAQVAVQLQSPGSRAACLTDCGGRAQQTWRLCPAGEQWRWVCMGTIGFPEPCKHARHVNKYYWGGRVGTFPMWCFQRRPN